MNSVIHTKTYAPAPFCEQEILRYAGAPMADGATRTLLRACMREAEGKFVYKVCYRTLPLTVSDDLCDFGVLSVRSRALAKHLCGTGSAILFAATVGTEIDRLIYKYGHLSPAKALLFQAIGAERIESLCDAFCEDIARKTGAVPTVRFSPGYGDLPITVQREVFALLDCERRIGLTLNDSLLMSPQKSVTAFVGLSAEK